VCISISIWLVYPTVIQDSEIPLLIAISVQLTLFAIRLIKFRRFPNFHTFSVFHVMDLRQQLTDGTLVIGNGELEGRSQATACWILDLYFPICPISASPPPSRFTFAPFPITSYPSPLSNGNCPYFNFGFEQYSWLEQNSE
jgi:hypothetical protein